MKKVFMLLLVTSSIFAQDFAKDTLLVNGSQPATIIKIKTHKIYIAQNKELETPYLKQKDGSFISNGVPSVQIHIDKNKHTIGTTSDYVDVLFDNLKTGPGGSNEIININNTRVLIHNRKIEKDKKYQIFVIYPLSDRFLNLDFVFKYKDDDDRLLKESEVREIIEKGLLVIENYYLKYKV
jgi:hypothetical protein